MSNKDHYGEIVTLAQSKMPPREIAIELSIDVDVVYKALKKGRAGGIDVRPVSADMSPSPAGSRPIFGGRTLQPQASLRRPEHARPREEEAKAPRVHWTQTDDDRLRELSLRGVKLTAIAAFIRKPYRMVIEAAERLELIERAHSP